MTGDRPIILILGPTAGGKTTLAIHLARHLPGGGECISADSMQVYRGMDIGTAKPTADERAACPHHLLDLAEPDDTGFTVDHWLERAEETIADVRRRGHWPIVVGGTNLYVQALMFGLFDGPEPDADLRARLNALDDRALRDQLERIDPTAASRIHPNDRRRTIRAIEVFERTGSPISAQQLQWGSFVDADETAGPQPRCDVRIIGLLYAPSVINQRINARVRAMMDAGLLEEVRELHEAGRLGRQAREALGYKQLIDHLEGRSTLDEAVEQIKIRTRRYAKQQRTWLRRFRVYEPSLWLDADALDLDDIARRALVYVRDDPAPAATGR